MNSLERSIVHMDLDTFFVSCERLMDSNLNNRPVLIGGTSDRGVVAACSYEARKYGVHSAMPMRFARQLCPEAIILRGNTGIYTKYSTLVTDVIKDTVPLYEKASIDEFYVDLTGMDKNFGCKLWSDELRAKIIKESGLPISYGLSINKLVSKVGTGEGKPNGAFMIPNGFEKKFLAPLSTAKIPGIGKVTYKKLSFMGVRTIGKLSEIPAQLLEREFGKHGSILALKSQGIDNSPIVPYSERKSISKETTYSIDTIDMEKIERTLIKMVMDLAYTLRKSKKLTSIVTIKLRYADFNTYTKQKRISYTASDDTLIEFAKNLFNQVNQKRQLIRLVGVKFGGLVNGSPQLTLFEDTNSIQLMEKMDLIRNKFGKNAITRASLLK